MKRTKRKREKNIQQINASIKGERRKQLNSIKSLIENGNTSKGYSELINYIEQYPTDPFGHDLLGKILLKRNDFKSAKKEFEVVIDLHGKNYQSGLLGLARIYQLEGDIEKARKYYIDAINNNPYSNLIPYLSLASLETEDKNYYGALNVLYRALDIDDYESKKNNAGNKNDLKIAIVKNLLFLNRRTEAEDILATIIPNSVDQEREILFRRATILKHAKRYEEAITLLEQIRSIPKKDTIYYQVTIEASRVYQELQRFEQQYACLEELEMENIQFDGNVSLLLGMAKLKKNDYKGAKETFYKGLEAPDFSARNLCTYYDSSLQYLAGDIVGAESTLKTCLEKNKMPFPLNYTILIRILYDQGRYEEARKYINEIRQLDREVADNKYSFRRLEILIDKKEKNTPILNNDSLYVERQFIDYDLGSAITYIENNHQNPTSPKSKFPQGTNISQLIEDIQVFLTDENKLMISILDEYEIPYQNAGYNKDSIKNHIRVKTIPGTKQIISLYPSDESLLPTKSKLNMQQEKSHQFSRINKFNERLSKAQQKK